MVSLKRIYDIKHNLNIMCGAAEKAMWLRPCTAPVEDINSVPGIHPAHNHL